MLSPSPFFFLRHGETDWNAAGRTQGRTNVPLNARGIAQAEHAAGLLVGHNIVRIVCSTLGRAQHTAEIVGAALGLAFTCDADLQEASFGVQEGTPMGAWYDTWVAGEATPDQRRNIRGRRRARGSGDQPRSGRTGPGAGCRPRRDVSRSARGNGPLSAGANGKRRAAAVRAGRALACDAGRVLKVEQAKQAVLF